MPRSKRKSRQEQRELRDYEKLIEFLHTSKEASKFPNALEHLEKMEDRISQQVHLIKAQKHEITAQRQHIIAFNTGLLLLQIKLCNPTRPDAVC